MQVPLDLTWEPFAIVDDPPAFETLTFRVPFFAQYPRCYNNDLLPVPDITLASDRKMEFLATVRHIELGIAEIKLFFLLTAAGMPRSLFGRHPNLIGTFYDPFVNHGLIALNYACYQDARFMIAVAPSSVTLAPECSVQQSIGTHPFSMGQDGLTVSSADHLNSGWAAT